MNSTIRYFARYGGLFRDVTHVPPPPPASRRGRHRALVATLSALVLTALLMLAVPSARASVRTIHYRGVTLQIPSGWAVYDLGRDPATCVRFDRHAVYLGAPGTAERCPPGVLGRTEAVLVSPRGTQAALPGGAAMRLTRGEVTVTATWGAHPALLRSVLGPGLAPHRLRANTTRTPTRRIRALLATARERPQAAKTPTATAASTVFTGLGFDTCNDPSIAQLTAWLASTYRAVGTYIGGANMGCAQANLNAAYTASATAQGWHLIPIYVGLQAPKNSCGCAAISASKAAAEGTAAAEDAATDAANVGISPGNPIYDDMEGYASGGTNTTTVMTFLTAWTTELHALGYQSGVYSSTDSGIRDLVANYSTGTYTLPDDIWNADWNNQQSTADAAIPSTEWANHQRLHQYRGSHNETWDGVKLNVDSDYVDGSTVGDGNVAPPQTAPTLSIKPEADGSIELNGSWTGSSGVAGWKLLGGTSATNQTAISGTLPTGAVTAHSALAYFSEQALSSTGQVLGTTPVTATPPHLAIYGHSLFVPGAGWTGVPIGCYTGASCSISTKIYAGKTLVASSKPESVRENGSGIVYVGMTKAGRAALNGARSHRLPVTVYLTDGSVKASASMTMIPFTTSGKSPTKSAGTGSVRVAGLTDFVSSGGGGGILAGCFGATPCSITTVITSGHTVLASTGAEFIGANELGYLSFHLTAAGKSALAHAAGNQLGAQVKLSDSTYGVSTASVALVRFS